MWSIVFNALFKKRGILHLLLTLCLLYILAIKANWYTYKGSNVWFGCLLAATIIGIAFNSAIEYFEELFGRKKLKDPYAKIWETSDIVCGAFSAPLAILLMVYTQNLIIPAIGLASILILAEIIRIYNVYKK